MTATETESALKSLGTVIDLYVWEDSTPVRRLLVEHPEAHGPLIHAARVIPSYFGSDARVSLGVEHDLDGNEPPRLAATIHTSQSPTEEVANLDRFDQDWWLDAMTTVHHHLSFGLRFE